MEKMMYLLALMAWIVGVSSFLLLLLSIKLSADYEGSLKRTVDLMNGKRLEYKPLIKRYLFITLFCIIYLIAYYTAI